MTVRELKEKIKNLDGDMQIFVHKEDFEHDYSLCESAGIVELEWIHANDTTETIIVFGLNGQ